MPRPVLRRDRYGRLAPIRKEGHCGEEAHASNEIRSRARVGPRRGFQGYEELLGQLKERIRSAQLRAVLAVNRELIGLYWQIGQTIVERQRAEGRGKSVVERLARDLQAEFPGIGGFSPRNVWRMRVFYLAYTEEVR